MKIKIHLKGTRNIKVIEGERIDILDFEIEGIKYKQIRVFKNGFSKSEYIKETLINCIKEL